MTVFTSGTPMRGLFKELIKRRAQDSFKLIFRNGVPDDLNNFFNSFNDLPNCEIVYEKNSRRFTNILALIGYKNYNKINFNCDLYISAGTPDIIATKKIPQIVMVADLSSIRTPKFSSLKWHGNLIFRNTLKIATNYATKIICISNYTKHDLINLYNTLADKVEVVYNGIEELWFNNIYKDFQKLSVRFSIKNKYWIWWGAITNRKNLWNLLNAYHSLIKDGYKLPDFLVIGSYSKDQLYIMDFIKKELNDKIIVLPFQDGYTLKTLVKNSEGLLFPSIYEGFGMPVIEAYSQGKPVMHSNVSSLPEIAGGLGISCDPYNIESIKNALLKMTDLKEDEYGIIRRKQWAKKFTYKNAAVEFSKIIDEVMDEKKN